MESTGYVHLKKQEWIYAELASIIYLAPRVDATTGLMKQPFKVVPAINNNREIGNSLLELT